MSPRAAPILSLALLAAAPARAEILDIRAEQDGDRARILFVFDSQPGGASITVREAEAQATIAGVHGEGQLLRPANGVLSQVSVADRRLGLAVAAISDRPILSGDATVYENSVLFELVLAPSDTPEPALMAEAAPPSAPPGPGVPEARLVSPGTVNPDRAAPPEPEPAPPPELSPEPEPEVELAEAAPEPDPADVPPAEILTAEAEPELEPVPDPETPEADSAPQDLMAEAEPAPEPEAPPAPEPAPAATRTFATDASLPPPSAPGPASELIAARLDRVACETAGEAVAASPWDLDALYDHGACLARDGQGARAQEIFQRIATFDPASVRALVALGALRQDAGDRGGAESYYERAMATGPGDGDATLIRILREGL